MNGPSFIARRLPVPVPWPARASDRTDADARRVDIQPTWRDEFRMLATVTGAMAIVFLPAAWIVVGVSIPFAIFGLAVTADWAIAVGVQIALLRALRSGGPGTRPPYVLQFLAIAAAGVTVKWLLDGWVGPLTVDVGLASAVGWRFVVGAWTDMLVALYLVYEREGRSRHALAARRLAEVQSAQVRARRELVDVQLRAVQARVDPQFFFDTLDAIEALYRCDAARAEALFDELVVFLRTALPHVDSASSVLARELALAESCLRIETLASGRECRLVAEISAGLMRSPFPAGVLLPLLQGSMAAARELAGFAIDLHAEVVRSGPGDAAIRMQLTVPRAPSTATFESVRVSLHALFGEAATLSLRPAGPDRLDLIVSLPHDLP